MRGVKLNATPILLDICDHMIIFKAVSLCFSLQECGMERERKQDGDKSRHDTIELVSIR